MGSLCELVAADHSHVGNSNVGQAVSSSARLRQARGLMRTSIIILMRHCDERQTDIKSGNIINEVMWVDIILLTEAMRCLL